jgi:predicted lipid-binding transport protein (Tim44 family)
MKSNKIKTIFLILIFLMTIFSQLAFGRAGGAGGGSRSSGGGFSHSSSSGSSYGGGYSRSYGNNYSNGSSSEFSSGILFFIVGIFILVYIISKSKKNANSDFNNSFNNISNNNNSPLDPETAKKISVAFMAIQESWSTKNLSHMRRFITDGVYQRFNAQFTMMNLLGIENPISDININEIQIAECKDDGNYELLTVQISAFASDKFISRKFSNLNSPGNAEDFVEYWSFIRRKDYKKGSDIFTSENCPKCSAPLTSKLVETAQCPYCSTYINNGEFDWVLAEITQEADFKINTSVSIPPLLEKNLKDFSIQLIEDRVSNAFMQILIATSTKDLAPLARFSTPKALAEFKQFLVDTKYLYDRLFLNSVDVQKIFMNGNLCHAEVEVVYSFRKIRIQGQSAMLLSEDTITVKKVITLVREISLTASKGSVFANSCPHCGAAQKDSLSVSCAYCSGPLNDPKADWIVDAISQASPI